MKPGDRVRYSRAFRGDSIHNGREGTVTSNPTFPGHVCVNWDDGNREPSSPYKQNLELIPMIDTTQPLAVNDGRAVTFVTLTSEGHILVTPKPDSGLQAGWMIFDKTGKFVRSETGRGYSLTLVNPVVRETRWIGLSYNPRFSPYFGPNKHEGTGVTNIECIFENGQLVDTKVHPQADRSLKPAIS